jgi:drug/metabolite transporter (DMT)-like permease
VNRRLAGYGLAAGAAASWGTWSLFLRPAERLGPLPSELEGLLVMSMVALVNLPLAALRSTPPAGLPDATTRLPDATAGLPSASAARPARAWLLLLALGASDSLNILLFFRALRLTTVAVAVLSHSLAPLLVAALAPWATGERPRARTWAAIVAALSGLVLLLAPWRDHPSGLLAGAAAGAGSALFYAFNVLAQKRLGAWFSAPAIVGYHALPSCLILALLVPAGGFQVLPAQVAIVLTAAVALGGGANLAFMRGLALIPASHAAVLGLLEPFVAVLVGVLCWGESLDALGAAGGLVVLASLLAAVWPAPAPRDPAASAPAP